MSKVSSINGKELEEEEEELEEDEYISYAEAGRLLQRSPQTISRWAMEGLLPIQKEPTGRFRVIRAGLQKFIDGSNLTGNVFGG